MIMRCHTPFVLSIFTTGFLYGLATPFTPNRGDVYVKHSWSSVPNGWMNLGHPAADTTIDLHISLKAQNENALIEALYEVSSPGHPKYVSSPLFHPCLTNLWVSLLWWKIWRTLVKRAGR